MELISSYGKDDIQDEYTKSMAFLYMINDKPKFKIQNHSH